MDFDCKVSASNAVDHGRDFSKLARLASGDIIKLLLRGMRAKVNLIPLNEAEELNYRRPSDVAVERFKRILTDHHIDAFVRKQRGDDISAACGQLRQKVSLSH